MRCVAVALVLPLCACAVSVPPATAGSPPQHIPPRTILMRGKQLAESRRRIVAGDTALRATYEVLIKRGQLALATPPVSVMEKHRTPPSGDRHDYMSMAPYWWPDSTKVNGLPFIRRDGKVYPASRTDHDGLRFEQMRARVDALALAWYFTGDARYSIGAANHLRVFFLDSTTRMNPNLNYAQAVLGVNDGRGIGIIDTRNIPFLLDDIRMLHGAPGWTTSDAEGMRAWAREFLGWLLASRNGRDERAAKNNHGTFYDAQAAALALFVGDTVLARTLLGESGEERIVSQIDADGRQPRELERTRPLHYSLFNLDAFTMLAELGRHVGVDLWHYTSPAGGSIEKALRFVAPYSDSTTRFAKPDVVPESNRIFLVPFRRGAAALGDVEFTRAIRHVPIDVRRSDISHLSFPAIP